MKRYRFALRPRWLLGHLLVLVLVVVMVSLGFWQLRRLHGRRDANRAIRAAESAPAVAWQDLFGPNAGPTRGHEVSFRPVTATGTYVPSDEVVVNARALNGGPGVWILTPLRLDSGRAVAVLRGFVPAPGPLDAPPRGIDPPAGRVTVTGIVQPLDSSPFPAPAGPSSRAFDNPDVARLATQVRYPLDPAYLQLRSSDPAQAGQVPVPLPPPTLDDGPHLNYAGQWFLFTAVVLIGWPLVLRRSAAQRDAERSGAGP